MDFYGIVCMDMYRDTCLEVWSTSFCVEMVIWFGCGPQWKICIEKMLGCRGDVVRFFLNPYFCFSHNLIITHPN